MTIGFVMLLSGIGLCLLGWKVSRPERDRDYLQADDRVRRVYQQTSQVAQVKSLSIITI